MWSCRHRLVIVEDSGREGVEAARSCEDRYAFLFVPCRAVRSLWQVCWCGHAAVLCGVPLSHHGGATAAQGCACSRLCCCVCSRLCVLPAVLPQLLFSQCWCSCSWLAVVAVLLWLTSQQPPRLCRKLAAHLPSLCRVGVEQAGATFV